LQAANADRLGRDASARSLIDPLSGAQLALAAWRSDPTNPAARAALLGSAVALQDVDLVLPDLRGYYGFTGIGEDDTAIIGNLQGERALIFGASGPDPQRWVLPDQRPDSAMNYGGNWLAIGDTDGTITIWDPAARAVRHTAKVDGEVLSIVSRNEGASTVLVGRGDQRSIAELDMQTGALSTERILPGAGPDLQGARMTKDGTALFETYMTSSSTKQQWNRRTLAADPAADVVTPFPDGTVSVGTGLAQLECVLPGAGAPSSSVASLRVVPVYGDVPARTVRLSRVSCDDTRISADRQWIVEDTGASIDSDRTVLRLTSIADGSQYQVVLPMGRELSLASKTRAALTADPTITARMSKDHRLTVYTSRSDVLDDKASNSTVLRARAWPVATGSGQAIHGVTTDGRFLVSAAEGAGVTVADRATGAIVASMPMDIRPDNGIIQVSDELWITIREPAGWMLRRYTLPELTPGVAYAFPGGSGAARPEFIDTRPDGVDTDEPVVVLLSDGMLAARDRRTGTPLGAPIALGSTDAEWRYVRNFQTVEGRPGRPGQALVDVGPAGLQLWDVPAGRLLGTVPVQNGGAFAATRDGARVAVLSKASGVEVYDLDTFRPARPPIAVSGIEALSGFDPDGYLIGVRGTVVVDEIYFVDVDTGRMAGSVAPGTSVRSTFSGADSSVLMTGVAVGQAASPVPLRATDWVARICGLMDRPFTDAELALLPDLTDTSPPCRR